MISFIKFINSASTFFRNDVKSALNYIGDQMDQAYTQDGFQYSVILQDNNSQTYNNFDLNPQVLSIGVYGSVAPGADKIYLNNTYMFILQPINQKTRVFFTNGSAKGTGLGPTE